jgi:hypothetical protein
MHFSSFKLRRGLVRSGDTCGVRNQPEDCSLSARLRVQNERQWWATEPFC